MPNTSEIKEFLEEKHDLYNQASFIDSDPIQIPHLFSKKEDIEIAGFLTSAIAWGNRKMIIRNAEKMIAFMQNNPYEFLLNEDICLSDVQNIGHRTFKPEDFLFFLQSLKNICKNHGGLEDVFTRGYKTDNSVFSAINYFRNVFFELPHLDRTEKHIANVIKNSAAKRINMFLMWMVRNDNRGVHFGLWDKISPADLMIPLDVHTGNTARSLGLLKRKQNDRKASEELTKNLKQFDSDDPIKYDFALFGLGVFEKFV